MKKYRPDRKSLNLLRVVSFILSAAIVIGLRIFLVKARELYPAYFSATDNTLTEIIVWGCMIAAIALFILFLLLYLPLWYSKTEYSVSQRELSLRTGVINTSTQFMKLPAIQYFTVISTPLSILTSFNFLILSAQGGKMVFPFLSKADCAEISDFLKSDIDGRSAAAKGGEG